MGVRRQAREYALQMLYQLELAGARPTTVAADFWRETHATEAARDFADAIVNGVTADHAAIDTLIAEHSANWKLSRMSAVDRNILRIAAFELLHREDIPAKVTINEAVDIAKRFGTAESGAFVNGILDTMARSVAQRGEEREGS